MKTRFDCADSWTTATGEEIQIKEMTTIHLMNLFSMFVRRPDRTMAMLVSDIDSGEYAERVWLPRKTEDVKQSIANVTSMSEAELIDYALSSPLGYIVLFAGNTVVGNFVVDGKVTSLNSFLSPDSEYYEYLGGDFRAYNKWLADVDGSYGENDDGIFFFTPDGKYIEWTGEYLYSDIPFIVDSPVVRYEGGVADE